VQTYPGIEYDFVPQRAQVRTQDLIHFQWTGANTNDANNAGEGTAGQDRSNVVQLRPYDTPYWEAGVKENKMSAQTYGAFGKNYPVANINTSPFLGLTNTQLDRLAVNGIKNAYIELLPVTIAKEGVFNYMSSRNNNFSNREQKGTIMVSTQYLTTAKMSYSGGHVFSGANFLRAPAGALSQQHKVTFTGGPASNEWESDWVHVEVHTEKQSSPHAFHLLDGMENTIVLHMSYTPSPFTKPQLYRTIEGETVSFASEFDHSKGAMYTKVNHGGMFVVKAHLNLPLIVGLGACTLFILGAVIAGSVAAFRTKSA